MFGSPIGVLDLRTEKDIEIVRQAALLLERENARLVTEITRLTKEFLAATGQNAEQLGLRIAALEEELARKNKQIFGNSSEKREGKDAAAKEDKPKPPGHGPRPQPQLPIIDVPHDLDEADKKCTACGKPLKEFAGETEDSDEITVVERRFVIHRHKRKKYVCNCGACVDTAPLPPKLSDGARYSIDFAIEVSVDKYLDHMPLEREARKMKREGLEIDSQTLWDQIERLARHLGPTYEALLTFIMTFAVVGADETHWRVMGKAGRVEGEAKQWQIWLVQVEQAVYYTIENSRSSKVAISLLTNFTGIVMCDGYVAYKTLARKVPSIRLAHCWAHARREFIQIESAFPTQADEIVGLIRELYRIESECPKGRAGDAERRVLRDTESRKVIARIQTWMLQAWGTSLPGSSLRDALQYMGNHWTGLTRFLDNPCIPLDNNGSERAARGPVIGRKVHYGSRSLRGTEVAAIFYSLIESAKKCDVDPKAYLRAATLAAIRGDPPLLPHVYAQRLRDAAE